MALDKYQSTFSSSSLFPNYKHKASENGDGSNGNGGLAQPIIATQSFTLPELDSTSYIPWSHNTHEDPSDIIQCSWKNMSRNHTDGTEVEGEADLCSLVSNILEETDLLDSYNTEGISSTFKSFWSPKTTRGDILHYFQSESKNQTYPAFSTKHTDNEAVNAVQGKSMTKDAKDLCQQLNGFNTSEQWLLNPTNGNVDIYTPQCPKLPPGLPVPTMGNACMSKTTDQNDVFGPQNKMSSQCFSPFSGDHSSQCANSTTKTTQVPQEVNKMVGHFQKFMAHEQLSLHGREHQNSTQIQNRQGMDLYYQDSTVEQRKSTSPATMNIQNGLAEEVMAVQRECNGSVSKQNEFRAQYLSRFDNKNTEHFHQEQSISTLFNPSNMYHNNTIMHKATSSLPVNMSQTQYSLHHNQQNQMQSKVRPFRGNCGPINMSPQSVTEFVPQHCHQMPRGPLCIQDYMRGDRQTVHSWPGQVQNGTGLASIRNGEDCAMQLVKNRMHMTDFMAERFSTQMLNGNIRTQTSNHARDGDMRHGLLQNPCIDPLANNSQRFAGQNTTMATVSCPQFLPFMYQLGDPRELACQIPTFSSRSVPPFGGGIPCVDLEDAKLKALNPAFNQLSTLTSDSKFSRMTKNQGSMSQLHFYLEECYEQCRCLENDRKKIEAILTKAFPRKQIPVVTNTPLPKMPQNPSRIDRLIVDHLREQAMMVSLLGKMERLSSLPICANVNTALERHYEAIYVTQTRRRVELAYTSKRHRQGGAHFRDDKDIVLLTAALKDLYGTTRKSGTALWCALQITLSRSVCNLDFNVNSQPSVNSEASSEENGPAYPQNQ